MLAAALQLLSQRAESINQLNVFPVPDGDTGTNMLSTMRSAARGAEESDRLDVGGLTEMAARSALMGARGNSGVILSQYFRGLARGLTGHARIDGAVLGSALEAASATAWSAVTNPVEGTMLSVAREVATAATAEAAGGGELSAVMRCAVEGGRLAVARTQETMPLLRQAGVVDAGGLGLLTILEGMYLAYLGQDLPPAEEAASFAKPRASQIAAREYGYCTEFLIRGQSIDVKAIRSQLGELGDSLLVVGDPELVRVHVHTFEPGRAIDLALKSGAVDQVKIENMQEQSDRYRGPDHVIDSETCVCGLVAVSVGNGFAALYRSFGASVVPGGQTLNPSTEEIVEALRNAPAKEYVLLPNNPNVVLAAQQAAAIFGRPVVLVPTRNLAEGIAAAVVFQSGRTAKANSDAMSRALDGIRTGLVTEAVRPAVVDMREIRVGDVLGLVDDRIGVVGADVVDVSLEVLRLMRADEAEIVTAYVGEGVSSSSAEALRSRIVEEIRPEHMEIVHGGQPHYRFILACE
jgi:DAK2 domain fusion protein YloV